VRLRPAELNAHPLHGVSHQLLAGSAVALGVMTVASAALGWIGAGRVLRPQRAITAATRRIPAGSLHERLALTGPRDELTDLADTIDGLLDGLLALARAQHGVLPGRAVLSLGAVTAAESSRSVRSHSRAPRFRRL
jgi:hypothetical protein